MIVFPSFLHNVYLVIPIKLTVTAKRKRFNRKQINICLRFAYLKYKVQGAMFKSATLDLQQKTIKRIVENYKRFCFIYMQKLRLQSLGKVSLLKPISVDNINNQPHHKLQINNEQL